MDLLGEIQQEIGRYRSLQKAHDHVESVRYELDKEYAELQALETRLDKEYREYEKLEGKSLKGFFYKVLGSKEEQLEKERQEYLQLALKFDELKEAIKLKEYELEVLEKKVSQFKSSAQHLRELKKKRESYLLSVQSPDSRRLRSIIREMDESTSLMTDIDEAVHVGHDLSNSLNQMSSLLKKARNWGRWDMSGSRGRMYKYHKHSNIDRAKQMAYRIQNLMSSFDREVRDVYPDFEGFQNTVDLESFNSFADIFFDNLITDWIVQQKIVNSHNKVRAVHNRVTGLLQSLEEDKKNITARLETLSRDKDALIVGEG